MTHDPTRDCEHGRLKGKCDVCDLQAEIERLRAIEGAAKYLVMVKGRYHTEQAFNKLKELVK
jgi:AmiR/NasT family two-component response regulator